MRKPPDSCLAQENVLLLGNKRTLEDGNEVALILDIQTVGFEDKYLGIPVPEGRTKDGQCQPVKEKIMKRFSDYAENTPQARPNTSGDRAYCPGP